MEGLHQDLPGGLTPACPAGHLGEELEGALSGVILGEKEAQIRGHHPHQADPGEMVALGDHLGAHQEVQVSGGKALQHGEGPAAVGGGVPVQAGHPCPGQQAPQFALHLLGAHPVLLDGGGLALGAALRHLLAEAAVVADEAVLSHLMAGHGHAALAALEDVAAKQAKKGPGIAPAV